METERYLSVTSPLTHFQSVDQKYTLFEIKGGHLNNQLTFWQNLSEIRTIQIIIWNNWQLTKYPSPQPGLYDMKFYFRISFKLVEIPILKGFLAEICAYIIILNPKYAILDPIN